jgi:hypothetical protein
MVRLTMNGVRVPANNRTIYYQNTEHKLSLQPSTKNITPRQSSQTAAFVAQKSETGASDLLSADHEMTTGAMDEHDLNTRLDTVVLSLRFFPSLLNRPGEESDHVSV